MSLCLESLKHKLCNLWNINAKVKHIIRKHHITWRSIRDRDLNYVQEELGGINFKFIHITHVVIVCLQIARHKTDVLSCVSTVWSSVRLAYAIPNIFSYFKRFDFHNRKTSNRLYWYITQNVCTKCNSYSFARVRMVKIINTKMVKIKCLSEIVSMVIKQLF